MANKVLVFLEQRNNIIKKSSFEAVSIAKKLAEYNDAEVDALIIGNEITNLDEASKLGLSNITHVKSSELENFSSSAYSKILSETVTESGANIIVVSNTSMGKEIAPKISIKLMAGLASDCISFENDNGNIIATRPVYAGKALLNVNVKSEIKIFTIRPNVFPVEIDESSNSTINEKQVSDLDLSSKVIETKKTEGKLDVVEADIIVSGGRGLKEADKFKLIEDLADKLNAAVGASRAVVDAGWRPHSEQVGQTGKTVSPSLYVAVGISGAIQHLAGMRSSKYIVAINKDKDAPIFQVADYGIVGDLFEIVPALIEQIEN